MGQTVFQCASGLHWAVQFQPFTVPFETNLQELTAPWIWKHQAQALDYCCWCPVILADLFKHTMKCFSYSSPVHQVLKTPALSGLSKRQVLCNRKMHWNEANGEVVLEVKIPTQSRPSTILMGLMAPPSRSLLQDWCSGPGLPSPSTAVNKEQHVNSQELGIQQQKRVT